MGFGPGSEKLKDGRSRSWGSALGTGTAFKRLVISVSTLHHQWTYLRVGVLTLRRTEPRWQETEEAAWLDWWFLMDVDGRVLEM